VVREALEAELDAHPAADVLSRSSLAMVALTLAGRLDDPETSPSSAASLAREFRETVRVLWELEPAEDTDRMTRFEEGLRAVS